jgi:hypothetical protein
MNEIDREAIRAEHKLLEDDGTPGAALYLGDCYTCERSFPCDVHRMAELKDAEIAELRREISEHVLRADSLRAELARVNEELESCEGENADLRSQLERSLTPKFSKGERAFLADSHAEGIIVTVTDEMWIEYEIIDERGGISDCMESSLSPLPEEPKPCEHREWKGGPRFSEIHLNVRGAFPFCPLCGASLTKETP